MGCDIHGFLEIVTDYKYADCVHGIPDDRSYDMFGLLAGVRNYADCKPISETRGLPEKLSWQAKESLEKWGLDAHSKSWLTVKDFKNHDWELESTDGRISTIDKETGKELSKSSYTHLMDDPEEVKKRNVELKYLTRKAKDLIPFAWKCFIDYMKALAEKYGDENVRIVFWFDN